jgi:hypothetical protein
MQLLTSHIFVLCTQVTSLKAYYVASSSFPKPPVEQFRDYGSWYSHNARHYRDITNGPCNTTVKDHRNAFSAPSSSLEATELLSICYAVEAYILYNLSTDRRANLDSAIVVLGLLPSLLSSVAPTMAETASLSEHRPVLSFLISMGALAIRPTRVFEYADPLELLSAQDRLSLRPLQVWKALAISACQYVLAIAAVINVVTTSRELGEKSIFTWGCTKTFLPLLWTSLAAVVHIIAASSYAFARRTGAQPVSKCKTPNPSPFSWFDPPGRETPGRALRSVVLPIVRRGLTFSAFLVRCEIKICANKSITQHKKRLKTPLVAVLLNIFAGCCVFFTSSSRNEFVFMIPIRYRPGCYESYHLALHLVGSYL